MKRHCSLCGHNFGEAEKTSPTVDAMAGAVCDGCARRLLAECGVELGRYLEGLGSPVMLVDPDGVVVAASPQALEKLGMDASEVEGRLCGDVFRCVNASLPGGCGKTVHCHKCRLRRCVVATIESKAATLNVPVRLKTGDPDDPTWLGIVVSSEYFSGIVLLRIDEFGEQAADTTPGKD
jgi:PAS domain-containing protein